MIFIVFNSLILHDGKFFPPSIDEDCDACDLSQYVDDDKENESGDGE